MKRNLIGMKFGKLTVTNDLGSEYISGRKRTFCLCVCDCGSVIKVRQENLVSGNTKSCGCFQREQTSNANKTHGRVDSRLYCIWSSMKARCTYRKHKRYMDYGGRGITICDEWRNDFSSFYNWAMANGYSSDLTIDRIDNDGDYCPENCRWADKMTQARNRRNVIMLSLNGETHSISEWAEIIGIPYKTLYERYRRGWNTEDMLITKKYGKYIRRSI